jgi:hypothetical protein
MDYYRVLKVRIGLPTTINRRRRVDGRWSVVTRTPTDFHEAVLRSYGTSTKFEPEPTGRRISSSSPPPSTRRLRSSNSGFGPSPCPL